MQRAATSDSNDPTRRLNQTAKLAVKLELETEKQRESSERVRDFERVFRKSEGVNRMREKKIIKY